MPETKRFTIRIPLFLRTSIEALKGDRTITEWILEAIQEKIRREFK